MKKRGKKRNEKCKTNTEQSEIKGEKDVGKKIRNNNESNTKK